MGMLIYYTVKRVMKVKLNNPLMGTESFEPA